MKPIYLLGLFVVLFFSCKKEVADGTTDNAQTEYSSQLPQSLAANIALIQHKVAPKTTDSDITTSTLGNPVQIAFVPKNAQYRLPKLFVFLPGTFSTPSAYQKVIKEGALQGYFTMGIAYDNLTTVEDKAGNNPDDKTAENIFEEYLTGNDVSDKVNIPRANSFENRIIKMLTYLGNKYPKENWKQFLNNDGTINWTMVSVAGHSQGADHTMYISKKRNLLRAGFFSGPYNFKLNNGDYPSFMDAVAITPIQNIYGFCHERDRIRVYSDVIKNWDELNMIGSPTSVDSVSTYNGSHQLNTRTPGGVNSFHGSTVEDKDTPVDMNGNPVFAPVWDYMCFPK